MSTKPKNWPGSAPNQARQAVSVSVWGVDPESAWDMGIGNGELQRTPKTSAIIKFIFSPYRLHTFPLRLELRILTSHPPQDYTRLQVSSEVWSYLV